MEVNARAALVSFLVTHWEHETFPVRSLVSTASDGRHHGIVAASGATNFTGVVVDAIVVVASMMGSGVNCRVPSTLRPLLGNTGAPKDELYSEEQIRSVLAAYVTTNGLELGGGSIKLDKLMISNLFNKKEPQLEGDPCPLEDVVKRLLGKLQLFHKVTRVTEQASFPSDLQMGLQQIQVLHATCFTAGAV